MKRTISIHWWLRGQKRIICSIRNLDNRSKSSVFELSGNLKEGGHIYSLVLRTTKVVDLNFCYCRCCCCCLKESSGSTGGSVRQVHVRPRLSEKGGGDEGGEVIGTLSVLKG